MQGLPQIFSLAGMGACFRSDLGGEQHAGPLGCGDAAGLVLRCGVDHEDLIDKRRGFHQLAANTADDFTDGIRLVECGNADG